MPIRKNIKISSVKRGHHEKHKKNFLKSKKDLVREKQSKKNIFKASKVEKKTELVGKNGKANGTKKKKREQNNNFNENEKISVFKAADILDMLDDNDSDENEATERTDNGFHEYSKRKKLNARSDDDDSDNSSDEEEEHMDQEVGDDDDDDEFPEQLELQQQAISRNETSLQKSFKQLLPIKTKTGLLPRTSEFSRKDNEEDKHEVEEMMEEESDSESEMVSPAKTNEIQKKKSVLSATEIMTERIQEFNIQKIRIGKICSGITEKPEDKVGNFRSLFELMQDENGSRKNLTSIRKLAMFSVSETFKDIIPDYKIGIIDLENQKVKKDTLARVTYENELLKYYKKFLRELENSMKALKPGKYSKRPSKENIYLAEAAIHCLCEILTAHPYFNFNTNIAQLLVIYLNCSNILVRKKINNTFIKLFKTDQRLDLTRHIVRNINHLVKKKSNSVFIEVISCLLSLQIKNINVEAEKEAELKQKKLEQHKSRLISMSKRERKRKKKLADLEKELMETQAEENKQTKHSKLTDISKLVFTIYFRILKENPKADILSCTLEGLAKFAHIINIEFFSDLIEVLNHLIEKGELGYREQLHCIQTVFAILSGQGEALNIDPARFYKYLYRNILYINAGKNHDDIESVIVTLENVLIKRRKNITHLRYIAFLKRLMTLSIQVLHNGALGCLTIVKNAMQLNSSLDILLDTENKIGSGKFDPFLDEPEFSNANCTSLFELSLLQRHYHPTVCSMAKNIANGCQLGNNILEPELSKLTPIEFYEKFNSSQMAFNPPIPCPTNDVIPKKMTNEHTFKLRDISDMCTRKIILDDSKNNCNIKFDFYSDLNHGNLDN